MDADKNIECDGKKCGIGKQIKGGKYVCPHNNLSIKYPHLILEWHSHNNPIDIYLPNSGVKVWWKCSINPCGCHEWESKISNRTINNRKCPYCAKSKVCKHNNLKVIRPELIEEWHPNNEPMENYSPCSGKKVLWKCSVNPCGCHEWEATISDRVSTKNSTGCPYCSNRKLCEHNNLEAVHSELIKEWHPTNAPMNTYSPGSNKKVQWICSESSCGCHIWCASIYHRTHHKCGCPFCVNQKVCEHNNLRVKYPNLAKEWHSDNKPMDSYSFGSGEKVKWICINNLCGCHIYNATIHSRTSGSTNCPYCANLKLCNHNNLEATHPELIIEWHPNNKPMKNYPSGSDAKVMWICPKNIKHVWEASICSRTGKRNNGCPHCSKSRGYSQAQIDWLTDIETKECIIIQHATKPEGEFRIENVGKVDGYCKETNTVYEFHGDYWHGNPLIFNREETNLMTKKTYGELYDKTIKRDETIRQLGYNLIIRWETETC